MSYEDLNYSFNPICATCGCCDQFEHNEDLSYIKCVNCGREYFGGKDELLEANAERIEALKEEISKDVSNILQKKLNKIFKK